MSTLINFRVSPELLEEAKALAASMDRSLAWVIRDLLKKAIAASEEKSDAQ